MSALRRMAAFGRSVTRALGYEAAQDSKRRKSVSGRLMHEDDQLTASERRKLLDSTRDAGRNFAVAAWAVRKHLDFVASHCFCAKTPDAGWNRELEAAVAEWSTPENCDYAGRHPLRRLTRLAEARRTVDGDMGFYKIRDLRLQAIEGDRIRQPDGGVVPFDQMEEWRHGVRSQDGRAIEYAIHRRRPRGGFEFERKIPARQMMFFACYEANHRFDATRGVSPMAAGLNSMRDTMENFGYALAKAKVAQMFGLVITREGSDQIGTSTTTTTSESEGNEKTESTTSFKDGPVMLDMEPGEDAKFLENKTPAPEFQAFLQATIAIALKSLDLDYSFFDSAHTNFFGSRAALLFYLQSANHKRRDVQELLMQWFNWRYNAAFAARELTPPASLRDGFNVTWVPDGLPWWRPLEEITADIKAISLGVKTREDVTLAHFGRTFEDTVDILEREEDVIRGRNINISEAPALDTPAAVASGQTPDAAQFDQDALAEAIARRVAEYQ